MEKTKGIIRLTIGAILVSIGFAAIVGSLIKCNDLNQFLGTPSWVGVVLTMIAIVVAATICGCGANLMKDACK